MKILFDDWALPYLLKNDDFPVGGWAVELSSWIRGLEACACDVEVLTWTGANSHVGPGNPVHLREAYRREGGIRVLKYFYHHIPSIVAAVRESSPDVVIQACSGIETAIMALAARRSSATFVHRLASDSDVDERIVATTRWYERWAFHLGIARAHAILCQNSYQLERVRLLYPTKPAIVLHNPFQIPAGAANLGHRSRSYIAWIANFGPAKNVPLLYRVALQNPDTEFLVAGSFSGHATPETHAAVESLKSLPNVQMMGYLSRDKVPRFLADARCLLSTSLYEGMSNTFLEALSVGTPILVPTRVDPDGIIGRFGLGLVAGSDDELIDLPRKAKSMKDEHYRSMSDRARSYVAGSHDPRRIAYELLQFLKRNGLVDGDIGRYST